MKLVRNPSRDFFLSRGIEKKKLILACLDRCNEKRCVPTTRRDSDSTFSVQVSICIPRNVLSRGIDRVSDGTALNHRPLPPPSLPRIRQGRVTSIFFVLRQFQPVQPGQGTRISKSVLRVPHATSRATASRFLRSYFPPLTSVVYGAAEGTRMNAPLGISEHNQGTGCRSS